MARWIVRPVSLSMFRFLMTDRFIRAWRRPIPWWRHNWAGAGRHYQPTLRRATCTWTLIFLTSPTAIRASAPSKSWAKWVPAIYSCIMRDYAIIGVLVVDTIVPASAVTSSRLHENAHTRRSPSHSGHDIVVRAKPGVSGRCERAIPIGHFASRAYRVLPDILTAWGGLSVRDGYLQRSARLPEFLDASKFYAWFLAQGVPLVARNN